jgi:hypothetical protein
MKGEPCQGSRLRRSGALPACENPREEIERTALYANGCGGQKLLLGLFKRC